MRQSDLYEPIRKWLAGQGFTAVVTGASSLHFVIPIGDLVPMPYKVPDVVAFKEQDAVIVEVETSKSRFFDALGRCLLWKTTATFVYMAYPAGTIGRAPLLERLGLGLLEISEDLMNVAPTVPLPMREEPSFHGVMELHPLDHLRQQELLRHIRAACV